MLFCLAQVQSYMQEEETLNSLLAIAQYVTHQIQGLVGPRKLLNIPQEWHLTIAGKEPCMAVV